MGNVRPSVPKTVMSRGPLLAPGGVQGLHAGRDARFTIVLVPAMAILIFFHITSLDAKVVKSDVKIGELLTRLVSQSTEQVIIEVNPREIERWRRLRVDRLLDIAKAHLELLLRVVGKSWNEHFGSCVTACYDALEDAAREQSPQEWAKIQNVVGLRGLSGKRPLQKMKLKAQAAGGFQT